MKAQPKKSFIKKQVKKRICPKCHLIHPKIEILYDKDEFYLIERLDRLRENHNIKVHEIKDLLNKMKYILQK